MQNELYFSMIYRPVVTGRRLVEKSGDPDKIRVEEEQSIAKVIELATNVEAVLKDYSPYRLGMYEAKNGIVFSETLEFLGYLLNRIDEPVPVLQAPVQAYLPVSKHMFANKTGDFVIRTPDGLNHFGAILNVKEYADGTYPGILNGLKYLDFEYVVTHSFSPVGRHDALKVLERTKGMMVSSGDKSSTQIRELDGAMDDVASGNFVLGEYHFTMAVYADSQEKLARQIATTRAELSNAGFVSAKGRSCRGLLVLCTTAWQLALPYPYRQLEFAQFPGLVAAAQLRPGQAAQQSVGRLRHHVADHQWSALLL